MGEVHTSARAKSWKQFGKVMDESFRHESRRRALWLAVALACEVVVIWLMFMYVVARAPVSGLRLGLSADARAILSLADARSSRLFQTVYFDPFYPALYVPSPHSRLPVGLLPEILSFFSTQICIHLL
jgi:hypothetical protein